MISNTMSGLHPQNYVSFGNNKAPNITTISGCNIGCRFYKYVIIESISEKPEITAETAVQKPPCRGATAGSGGRPARRVISESVIS